LQSTWWHGGVVLQKWPFMLTANRWLDYRIVLLPEFVKNSAQLNALVSLANKCSQGEAPSEGFKRMDSPELGRLMYGMKNWSLRSTGRIYWIMSGVRYSGFRALYFVTTPANPKLYILLTRSWRGACGPKLMERFPLSEWLGHQLHLLLL
jgi:hypothetical protein